MTNKLNIFFKDCDTLLFTSISISMHTIHEVLSISGLFVSLLYTVIKIKKDFFNKKDDK